MQAKKYFTESFLLKCYKSKFILHTFKAEELLAQGSADVLKHVDLVVHKIGRDTGIAKDLGNLTVHLELDNLLYGQVSQLNI